jgi:P27 family predicted phage terminase small subunit
MNQKTPEYHDLTGAGDRKSRAKASETVSGTPRPPSWMSKAARREFRRVAGHLAARGTVSPADEQALTLYACSFARFITAQQDLDTNGQRIKVKVLDSHGAAVEIDRDNPSLKLVQTEAKTLLTFLRQLGMTPATREKIKPTKPNEEDEGGGFNLLAELEKEHAAKR